VVIDYDAKLMLLLLSTKFFDLKIKANTYI